MAHSPPPKPRRDRATKPARKILKVSTATCKYAFTYQTRSRRLRKRRRCSRFPKLYHRCRLFRLGYNTARRRLEEGKPVDPKPAKKEKVQIIQYETDPKLLEYLKRAEANNHEWTKENAKLKGEKTRLQSSVDDIYRAELDLYEISVKLEDFQRKYAQALVHMEQHGIATTNFTQFLPGYKRIAADLPGVRRVATELTLPSRAYSSSVRHVKYHPDMDLGPLNEEEGQPPTPAPRTASRSWFGTSAQPKKTEGKRQCRRFSIAPGDLDRVVRAPPPPPPNSLVEQDEAEEKDGSPDNDVRSTPKKEPEELADQTTPKTYTKNKQSSELGHVSVLTSPEIPMPLDLVQETVKEEVEEGTEEKKENIQFIPDEDVGNKKRSFDVSNKAENKTPNRRPTGVSASPRLSLRSMSMRDNGEPKSGNSSEGEEDDNEVKSDESLPSVRSFMSRATSGGGTDKEYTDEEEEVPVASFSSLTLDESSGDAGLTLSQRSGRPQRAARAKIQSMKQPSLNTKMRRPANVPSLHTPSGERRTGLRKGTTKKAVQQTRSKSCNEC